MALRDQLVNRLLRSTSGPAHSLPPNDFIRDIGIGPAPAVVLIHTDANHLTLSFDVGRRSEEDAKGQGVGHDLDDIRSSEPKPQCAIGWSSALSTAACSDPLGHQPARAMSVPMTPLSG